MKSKNKTLTCLVYRHATTLIGAAFVFAAASASAADAYWNNTSTTWDTATSTWNDVADGSGTTGVWVDGNSAVFSAGAALTGGPYTLTNGGVTVDNITQEEGRIQINGSTLTLADTAMAIDVQTRVSGDYDVRINSIIANSGAGASSITKNGAGMLMLTGNNTFSGGVTLNTGTLNFESSATAFGAGTLTLAGGNLAKTWGSNTTIANAVNVTGTTNVGVVQGSGADFVLSGTFTGAGTFQVSNTAINTFNPVAASIKVTGDISGFTGTFSQTTGNNRLRFGPTAAGETTINASQAKFFTAGSTSSGNPIDMADKAYGTFQMGELAGTGGIVRGGWGSNTAGGGTTTFEVGALNTSSQFAGSLMNNLGTGAGASSGFTALTKVGAGTLTLTGANSYTAATTVNGGTLQIGNGTTGSIAAGSAVTLGASGTLALNLASGATFANTITNDGVLSAISANAMTVSSGISGTGSLQKTGAGTLTLSGSNSHAGATTVTGGTLNVTGSITTSAMTLGAATLSGSGSVAGVTANNTGAVISNGNGNTATLTLESLAFNSTGTVNLNKVNDTGTAAIAINGNLNIGSGFTLNVTTPPAWTSGDTYELISYGSLSGSFANITKGAIPGLGARQAAVLGNSGSSITLTITGDSPVWTGIQSNAWTTAAIGGSKNWKLFIGGTATDFLTNDQVIFDDSAAGTTSVNIPSANVQVASVVFNNDTKNYTISSTGGFGIADGSSAASLTKNNVGTVTLTTTNSYTGATTISNGTLQLGDGTTDGDIASSSGITNDATLVFNRSGGSFTYGNAISGFGEVIKNGAGTQILTGSNTYSGDTTINAGILQVGSGGTTGTLGSSWITNDASLVFNRSNAVVQGTDFSVIDGTGSVVQAGAGSLTLSSFNNYSGGTNINSGTVVIGSNDPLGTGTVNLAGGALTASGNYTLANALTAQASTTSVIATNGTNLTLNGNLSGSGDLNRTATGGAASVYLGGDNSGFSGTFTVENNANAATRFTSATSGSANAKWVINQPTSTRASVDSPGGTIQFGSLTGTGFLTAQGTGTTTIQVGNLGLNESYSGVLNQGAGSTLAVTKIGAGTWTLTGTNTYTGDTTVSGGILAVDGDAIANTNKLVIDGGKVDPSGVTEVVDTLYFGATQQAAGTWGATGSGADNEDDTHFTGTGVVSVTTGPVAGYSAWADANGATGQTMDQDHDGDGVDNGVEYFMGETGSTFTANPAPVSGTVTWPMDDLYTGVYGTDYEVQTSTDLVNWAQVADGIIDNTVIVTAGTSVVYDMPTGGKSFVRLVVKN